MKTFLAVLAVFLIGLSMVSAQGISNSPALLEDQLKNKPDNPEILLKLGIIYHDLGARGDKDAVEKASDYLEKLIRLNPGHAEAHCWYGSVLTLKGRDAWFPLSKANYVNKGMTEMDKAVSLAPDNIRLRMIRAANGLALPDMFNRLQTVVSDYEYLKNKEKEKPGSIDSQTYLLVLFNLGLACAQKGDYEKSRENLHAVNRIAPDSELSKSAQTKLAKLDTKAKQ